MLLQGRELHVPLDKIFMNIKILLTKWPFLLSHMNSLIYLFKEKLMTETPSLNVADGWGVRDSSLLQQETPCRCLEWDKWNPPLVFFFCPCTHGVGKSLKRVFLTWGMLQLQVVSARSAHLSPYAGALWVSYLLFFALAAKTVMFAYSYQSIMSICKIRPRKLHINGLS